LITPVEEAGNDDPFRYDRLAVSERGELPFVSLAGDAGSISGIPGDPGSAIQQPDGQRAFG
jgi:hypothetical protein